MPRSAEHQRRFYGLEFDPGQEILITAGATEAIAAAMLGLCEPGDEVVVFEPYYDSYAATIAMAGATRRLVPLHAPDWHFSAAELDGAISERTRLVLLNTPHNPTGKVFSREELALIADRCVANDLYAVTDEVYEHLVYEGRHIPLSSFPGMAERTVTISSGGKTFSFTGWKVGWACAPAPLLDAVRAAKQFLTYVNGAPFQPAIAAGLGLGDEFFTAVAEALREQRTQTCSRGGPTAGSVSSSSVLRRRHLLPLTTDISSPACLVGTASSFCLEPCRSAAGWSPSRAASSTTTSRRVAPSSAGRSVSAPTCSPRRLSRLGSARD